MIVYASKYTLTAGIVTCFIEVRNSLHCNKAFYEGKGIPYFRRVDLFGTDLPVYFLMNSLNCSLLTLFTGLANDMNIQQRSS